MKKKKLLRILLWVLLISGLVALLLLGVLGFRFWQIRKLDPPSEKIGVLSIEPGTKIKLGDTLTLKLRVLTPWHRDAPTVVPKPGDGSQLKTPPRWSMVGLRWGYTVRELTIPLQAYRTGSIPEGAITIRFDGALKDSKEGILEEKIPALEVEPLNTKGKDLSIAGRIKESSTMSKWSNWLTGGFLIVFALTVIIILLVLKATHEKKRIVVRPWDIALAEIRKLRAAISENTVGPETSIARLSDIVRIYLEKRFRLHAPRQTTTEFLSELERPGSPLNDGQRSFLKDFLLVSDLVKFAGYAADKESIGDALSKAERLVLETRQTPETNSGGPR